MEIEGLEVLVIEWAKDKGIFDKGTLSSQFDKTQEEVTELKEAISQIELLNFMLNEDADMTLSLWQRFDNYAESNFKDAIGDVLITLIILCKMQNTNINDCLHIAYNEIKDRKGKMINGTFVKD